MHKVLDKALKAQLILSNGMRFDGKAFGYLKESVGEAVFFTSSAGYQEALTDPALEGQILVMTHPMVGNYGVNLDDNESEKPLIKGLVVRGACDEPNNWRCEMDLDDYLKQHKIMGIYDVDTRAVTRAIRKDGAMNALITTRHGELSESQIKQKLDMKPVKMPKSDWNKEAYTIENIGRHIAVIDLGVLNSTLTELKNREVEITVFPASVKYEDIMKNKPDAVLFSSGYGDPSEQTELIGLAKMLFGKLPVFGIGLGNMIIARAMGCSTEKMKYGHHGASYPVKHIRSGKIYITPQNINYTITQLGEETEAVFVNINDGSIEGVRHKKLPIYGVSFYPKTSGFEGSAGEVLDKMLVMIKA